VLADHIEPAAMLESAVRPEHIKLCGGFPGGGPIID
jgi:hypothetical protein